MNRLNFQVEFLSDIVLPASSNTEGNIKQLDFIPGSNFLGMVAKRYADFENSFDIFHSGKVRFGDATIVYNNKVTYKMPLSYFYDKSEEKTLYNHHQIDDFKVFEQLKQKRSGYITEDLERVEIEYSYFQKSAYDKKNRRSLDSSMFGYSAIKSGTKWQFNIKYENISEKDLGLLKDSITGTQRLGKSKSSQYGLVNIKYITEKFLDVENKKYSDSIVLYANSRLALVDNDGNQTYELKYLFDGLTAGNIDYSKCQIKTSTFTPYNGARQTKDYERVCISSGSVIVLKDLKDIVIPSFVGAYQSEGFGELLLNLSFLEHNGFELKEKNEEDLKPESKGVKNTLISFLQNRETNKKAKLDILNDVDKFISDNRSLYKNIKPSQWGKIRSICTSSENNFKDEMREYISTGVKAWNKEQIDALLQDNYSLEFIKLISIQMPKQGAKNDK